MILLLVVGGYSLLTSNKPRNSLPDNDIRPSPATSLPAESEPSPAAPTRTSIPTTKLYVTATTLNVRASPSMTATLLFSAPQGTTVIAISRAGDWYEVQLNNGGTAWMHGTYLSPSRPEQPVQLITETAKKAIQPVVAPPAKAVDRNAVIEALIAESIRSYSGSCPCPYNRDRAGRSCGKRSAWSKPGGASPLCYPQDVTEQMIQNYVSRR